MRTAEGNVCAHNDVTAELLASVRRRIGTQKFSAWFRSGTSVAIEEGCVKVGAANPFAAGWIESHFTEDLAAAAEDVTGQACRIMVSVDPALSGQVRKRQFDAQASLVAEGTSGGARRPPAPATTLRHRLADFVVGPCNQLAYSGAKAVAEGGPSPFNCLFIHGPCGVGKTHLLHGICNAVAGLRRPGGPPKWKYLSAEQFTNEFVAAIRARGLEAFRKTYRRLDVLVVDDVHFLAAKKATQEEFLHTFNTIESAGRQVVMASDAHPRMVASLAEQLVSRFLAGMVVKIDCPDHDTRVRILRQFAAGLKLAAPPEVLEYIAANIRGSVRELEGALVKLAAVAALSRQPISLLLARDALADHLAQTGSAVTLGDIESAVAAFFGITPADLHSTRRTRTVSLARAVAMLLARSHTRMSFPEIGRFMGKNHSTAVQAVQKMTDMLAEGAACHWTTPAGPRTMPAGQLIKLLTEQFT